VHLSRAPQPRDSARCCKSKQTIIKIDLSLSSAFIQMADTDNLNEENGTDKNNGNTQLKRKRTDEDDNNDNHEASSNHVESEQPKKLRTDNSASLSTASAPIFPPSPVLSTPYSSSSSGGGGSIRVLSETSDSMLVEIPHDKVGQLIGSKGMVIIDIQTKSGSKAVVNQDFPPGVPRQVQLNGTSSQMKNAFELIRKVIEIGPTAIHNNSLTGGPVMTTVIEANQPQIGKIIGTGGNTIKEIQSKSGAKIQIDQDYPLDVPRKINITGTSMAVNTAVQMVQSIISTGHLPGGSGGGNDDRRGGGQYGGGGGGGGHYGGGNNQQHQQQQQYGGPPPPSVYPSYPQPGAGMSGGYPGMMGGGAGGEVRDSMDVAKAIVGKIIGKGGENIHMLQAKSGCNVKVDQQVPEVCCFFLSYYLIIFLSLLVGLSL
jgi:rRNA processing protein Krr1/Pno1